MENQTEKTFSAPRQAEIERNTERTTETPKELRLMAGLSVSTFSASLC
jgi:hypothetical protein